MIEFNNISKTFKVQKRDSGIKEAMKSLFSPKYEKIKALDNISFNVKEGEAIGYIGPNGAGKSTTIKIMCGILRPDKGKCIINGYVPYDDRVKYTKNIGVVFGQRSQLWWDVPVIESYELIKDIYDVDESIYNENLNILSNDLDLKEILRTPTRNLSLGQRMRCEIGASLLHNPKVLFLDEPTIGLDAPSKIAVRKFINNLNKNFNTTIILTTHDMQDVEAIVDRIILIGKGKKLLDDNYNNIKHKFSNNKNIKIQYTGDFVPFNGIRIIEKKPNYLYFTIDESTISLSNVISKISNEININNMEIESITAEEMVLKMYEEYKI